jgi:predicted ABC-type ATPase
LFLREIDRLAASQASFAFESTLSGRGYAGRIRRWKANGYRVEIIYLTVPSSRIALRRIAARVRQGGHNVASADVIRRFRRSWTNFVILYRPLADGWMVYDNAVEPELVDQGPE